MNLNSLEFGLEPLKMVEMIQFCHTVEVSKYPVVAGAYEEDMELAEEDLQSWIDAAGL